MKRGFCDLLSGVVFPEWIDRNGHMNACYYMSIFNDGTDSLLRLIGISDSSIKKEAETFVASRIYISHRKELVCSEPWQLSCGFINITYNYMTMIHRLKSGVTVKAHCYIRGALFCVNKRLSKVINNDFIDKAKNFTVDGLRDPFDSIMQ